jgi:PAS domain S-box-containing protein
MSPSCEQVSGYTPDEFYAKPELLTTIIHPDDVSIYIGHTHRLSDNGLPSPIYFRIQTKGGDTRWIAHVCRPVFDLDGKANGFRASNRDETERRKLEELVRELAFYDGQIGACS